MQCQARCTVNLNGSKLLQQTYLVETAYRSISCHHCSMQLHAVWQFSAIITSHTQPHTLFKVPRFKPLGVVLISINNKCLLCVSKLQLRKDRPAPVVVYDDSMGTIPGTKEFQTAYFQTLTQLKSCHSFQYRLPLPQVLHESIMWVYTVLWLLHHWRKCCTCVLQSWLGITSLLCIIKGDCVLYAASATYERRNIVGATKLQTMCRHLQLSSQV